MDEDFPPPLPPPLPPAKHRKRGTAAATSISKEFISPPPLPPPNRPGTAGIPSNNSTSPPPLPPPNRPKKPTLKSNFVAPSNDNYGDQPTPSPTENHYVNLTYKNGCPDMTDVPLSAGSGIPYQPNYVNIPTLRPHSSTGIETEVNYPPRTQTVLKPVHTHSPLTKQRAETSVTSSHAIYNGLPPRQVSECSQCRDLLEWLSLWGLGMSGLTRQYSQILAQLNHARKASTIIECKMREGRRAEKEAEVEREEEQGDSDRREAVKSPRKVSAPVEEGIPSSINSITDQMYPKRMEVNDGADPPQLPEEYSQYFVDLANHLGRAIDLCQQLAASSFKDQTSSILKMKMKDSLKRNVQRQTSTPVTPVLEPRSQPLPQPQKPLLQRLTEDPSVEKVLASKRRRGLFTRMETEPALTTSTEVSSTRTKMEENEGKIKWLDPPAQSYTKVGVSRSKTQRVPKKEKPVRSSIAGDLFDGGKLEVLPVRSHMMSSVSEVRKSVREKEGEGGGESGGSTSSFPVAPGSDSDESEEPLTNSGSTFSDTDVKQVMSKIALLEDERLRLLETIDQMQNDNQSIRLSLYETLGDLENKDLQLTLAMQDLSIATDEIRRVAGLRAKLDTMEKEREHYLDKLGVLEDESAAVKVSLIQLLQEKSATNKTLALENWRLRQTIRQSGSLSRTSSKSSANRDSYLPDTCMKDEDLSNYVHKQGFLVKQGKRVKSWKRRLFVLDANGLSYYRTEQPIQKVNLSDIKKIQVSHNNQMPLPHMFEVHTRERVFLLSASSEDEMQSWIGMLQTLKQYARHRSPTHPHQNGTTASAILHQIAMENGATVTNWEGSTLSTTAGSGQIGEDGGGGQSTTNRTPDPALRRSAEKGEEKKTGVSIEEESRNGVSGGTVGARPRSQAFMMSKPLSIDEATPQSSRPMSVAVTTDPGTSSSMEWVDVDTPTASPSHNSPDDTADHNKVLSKSHPGTTAHQLTTIDAIFET